MKKELHNNQQWYYKRHWYCEECGSWNLNKNQRCVACGELIYVSGVRFYTKNDFTPILKED